MKTTIEIPDDLARRARAFAARENITLRTLVERGLLLALRSARKQPQFALRDASVDGNGLQAQFLDAEWARVREAAYEDRGG